MVHSRRSNIDCMEDLCTYYVHIILPNPVTTLQRMCHCSHFTGRALRLREVAYWLKDPGIKIGQPEMQTHAPPAQEPGSSPLRGSALTPVLYEVLAALPTCQGHQAFRG